MYIYIYIYNHNNNKLYNQSPRHTTYQHDISNNIYIYIYTHIYYKQNIDYTHIHSTYIIYMHINIILHVTVTLNV